MMKRNIRFKFRRFNHARMLFSLAVCSLVLVGFSAVAYAMAIPPALSDAWSTTAQSIALSGGLSAQGGSEGGGSASSQAARSSGEDATSSDPGLAERSSATLSPLSSIPAFISTLESSVEGATEASQETEATPPDSATPDNATPDDGSGSEQLPDTGSGEDAPLPDEQTGLDPAIEAGIHAHLVACSADLEPYYNQVCEGFSNLYATMNDPSLTHVSCAPTDARALLGACDQGRIRVHAYDCDGNGAGIPYQSKWYEEASKLGNCFNDLTNACSILEDVRGFTVEHAPGVLAKYLNADGEVMPLVEFRERYASLRL